MNRKSVTRARRKELMKLGTIVREEILNRDDDGTKWPKKEWGYSVEVRVNGYNICAPDHNRFEAMKAALECARWISKKPPFDKKEE